jgi:hypothetical protein
LLAVVGDVWKATYHFAFASGALRWGVHGSQFFAPWLLVDLYTYLFVLKFFLLLEFIISLTVWSQRSFVCARYRRGRNVIPLLNKYSSARVLDTLQVTNFALLHCRRPSPKMSVPPLAVAPLDDWTFDDYRSRR